ncbi:M15 family metallopeptidase [Amycolatopsis tucumanensis]|uniref:M15 family metallopeptidase n=1 Tax=Amycolatopsis sp. NPDC006125 TaxID=3156730 RepID=UPI001EF00BB8|nr:MULTISPECIES: M15 family metallopeptidase [Amycolatopsis]MCF6423158.1 M15 family metallopeptidase [Amycolatopsis tucumanensis]
MVALLLALGLVACGAPPEPPPPPVPSPTAPAATTTTTAPPTTTTSAAPPWTVGATTLPRRPDGFGEIRPTPAVLRDRRLPTRDFLPPPADGRYASTVSAVPADVLARSTWQPACPVAVSALRYLTMSFWGFDGKPHTGEMLVGASVAEDVTRVFGQLFAARFPIEEMRVTSPAELDAPPTGDGNNTSAFVCRPVRGQTNWSAHAYGLAIDLNPFCNPYTKGDVVLPELASAYLDRSWVRPGMVEAGDATVRAFAAVGWDWGGAWREPVDRMHFTATGG